MAWLHCWTQPHSLSLLGRRLLYQCVSPQFYDADNLGGYGDIVPVSDIALVLTDLEVIVGQMYLAIFIAILIGSYLSSSSHK